MVFFKKQDFKLGQINFNLNLNWIKWLVIILTELIIYVILNDKDHFLTFII